MTARLSGPMRVALLAMYGWDGRAAWRNTAQRPGAVWYSWVAGADRISPQTMRALAARGLVAITCAGEWPEDVARLTAAGLAAARRLAGGAR